MVIQLEIFLSLLCCKSRRISFFDGIRSFRGRRSRYLSFYGQTSPDCARSYDWVPSFRNKWVILIGLLVHDFLGSYRSPNWWIPINFLCGTSIEGESFWFLRIQTIFLLIHLQLRTVIVLQKFLGRLFCVFQHLYLLLNLIIKHQAKLRL